MKWTADLAYSVGLITTDGSLSKDGRHINLTSKDLDQITTFASLLHLKNKIGRKKSSYNPQGIYYQIQFGDVQFYRFLLSIGITPNKTKNLGSIDIPPKYFVDFLRGHLDGDGFTYSYWDKRWKNSFMLYTGFISASKDHISWLQDQIKKTFLIKGVISFNRTVYRLMYAKKSSLILLNKLYYKDDLPCLKRKRFKIAQCLAIIRRRADMLELVDRHA
jgi:hypothetical protein